MEDVEHIFQVTSFGGAGTTMLCKFLTDQGAGLPTKWIDWAPWKHMKRPPSVPEYKVKDEFRAIYLYGNPMNTVISLFRRKNQIMHAKRMKCKELPGKYWLLARYAENGKDLFEFTDHFNSWTKCTKDRRSYPIMAVRYETMWDHLEEILKFARVPLDKIVEFPEQKQRNSDWETQPADIKSGLYKIYGNLYKEMQKFPDIEVL